MYKLKAYKHKRKNLKEKLEKLGNIPQAIVFMCPPPPTKIRTQEYICKNLNQDISVSNTAFSKNQAWKHDLKHKFVSSSLKTHFFIHTCYKAEWRQFKSFQVVLGCSILHQRRKCASFGPLKQKINAFFY